uniref:Uncharacterized protein n=1 Tax=Anguilla anguilla TaxID=7936 RepID=A0A0E9U2L7_ANGAN
MFLLICKSIGQVVYNVM